MEFKEDRIGPGIPEAMDVLTQNEQSYYDSLKSQGYLALGAEIQSLRSQLAASLRLQADLAEENVRTRARLEDAEKVIDFIIRKATRWKELGMEPTIMSLEWLMECEDYRAKYPKEGK